MSDKEEDAGFLPEPAEFITVEWPQIGPAPDSAAAEPSGVPEDWDCGEPDCRACRRYRHP